jgi:uncharacterized protein YggT (Ycf19 family)
LSDVIYILVQFISIFIEVITWAMCIRAVISWFYDGDGVIVRFLYVVTEPALMPVRKLFEKMNWFQDSPIDVSYGFTYIVLIVLQMIIGWSL